MQHTKNNLTNIIPQICSDIIVESHPKLVQFLKRSSNVPKSHYKNRNVQPVTVLSQKDFDYGTYRITHPGYYILTEDITFHPNPNNNFRPTSKQIKSKLYPVPGPYNLNFFAAITIETTGVILDLNNHTIKQSKEHFLVQRFYANIELASAPFINPQGPSPGISGLHRAGEEVAIINGTLGLSSHHGIHGNSSKNVLLANLTIENFQVGGISLNGLNDSIFYNLDIKNTSTDVPILSSFSQAIFTLQFLENMIRRTPDDISHHIIVNNKKLLREEVYNNLNNSIHKATKEILKTNETNNFLFRNESKLSDANVYGISLNVNGVLVGDFLKKRPNTIDTGNENILLKNINISNIISNTKEIIGLSDSTILNPNKSMVYGAGPKAITGPVGGLFDYEKYLTSSGTYISNVLGNAQAFIALYSNNGTTFFTKNIIDWIRGDITIETVLEDRNTDKIFNADSMNHVMKGNIGFFISGGKNINCEDIIVEGVENQGVFIRKERNNKRNNKQINKEKGEKAFKFSLVACEGVTINNKSYNSNTFIE